MAGYRQIHTQIWKDDWFIELSPDEKLLFIYLFSNESSNLVGLYKISTRVIANETGLNTDFIMAALKAFEDNHRVVYRDGIIWIVHMWRYHNNASPKVQSRIRSDLELIPDAPIKRWYQFYQDTGTFNTSEELIQYPYSIDTTSHESNLNLTELNLTELKKEESNAEKVISFSETYSNDPVNYGPTKTDALEDWRLQEIVAINRGKKELADKFRPDVNADWKTITDKTNQLRFELRRIR